MLGARSAALANTRDNRMTRVLMDSWLRGRAAWPGVDLDGDSFIAYLRARLASDTHPGSVGGLAVNELYLTCACVAGNRQALAAFEATYFPGLDGPLRRNGFGRVAIEEVKQELRIQLFIANPSGVCGISKFGGRGQLRSWLRVVALRTANRWRSKTEALEDMDDLSFSGVVVNDTELALVKDAYRAEFRRAFAKATRYLDPRSRT